MLLAITGCLWKPNRVDPGDGGGGDDDASGVHDAKRLDTGAPPGFSARLISIGYYNAIGGATLNQTANGFTLPNTVAAGAMSNVVEGDLVLIFGNIDNDPTITPPTPGFMSLVNHNFGADGQVYYGYWKIAAAGDPDHYTELYTNASGSSRASSVAMVAITGAATMQPAFHNDNNTTCLVNDGTCGDVPVLAISNGVTTTAANSIVVYVGGADWLSTQSVIAFTQPTSYMGLAAFSDEGNNDFWWSSLMVAWAYAPVAGPSGQITGTLDCTQVRGLPWTIAVGVAPAS